MKQKERQILCINIKYELQKGSHTFTQCECGRHGCRGGRCWECMIDEIYDNKLKYALLGADE